MEGEDYEKLVGMLDLEGDELILVDSRTEEGAISEMDSQLNQG